MNASAKASAANANANAAAIYNASTIHSIYKIIKAHYNFNEKTLADFKIAEAPLSVFDDLNRDLKDTSNKYFNFGFAHDYIRKCNRCYHITYKGLNMYIILDYKISSQMRMQLFRNLYRVYLVSQIYKISKWGDYMFNYYVIMNPLKRRLPAKRGQIIDAVNINGGYTYINKNNIYIIRKEDYNKVIIHELLHHNTLIHKEGWNEANIKRLKAHFKIHPKMLLIPNEAIIETFACILNTVFYSIETGTRLRDNFKRDQEHSINLTRKILDKQGDQLWDEKTHSYCYIVLKTILYVYFNEFLKIYKYHNDTEITDFLIKKSQKIYKRVARASGLAKRQDNRLKQTIY
jgi:hypothetical protein